MHASYNPDAGRPYEVSINGVTHVLSTEEIRHWISELASVALVTGEWPECDHCGEAPGIVEAGVLRYCAGCWQEVTQPDDEAPGALP